MDITTLFAITFLNNTLGAYVQSVLTFVGIVLALSAGKLLFVRYLGRLAGKTITDVDDFIVSLVSKVGLPVFTTVALYVSTLALVMPDSVRSGVRLLMVAVIIIRTITLVQELARYAIRKFYAKRIQIDGAAGELIVSSLTGISKWVIWVVGIIFLLDNLGVNISTFVAGLGIGGVAVALASQHILGDAFSAFSIFLDRPFEIGDFIIVDDFMGTIEHIGVKTTRVRSLSGEQLVFSNTDLTKSRIKNYKRMQTRRVAFKFGVVYGLPVEKIELIPTIVKNIVEEIADVRLDRVHLQSFGDFSLLYEVVYFINSPDYNAYMDRQQQMNVGLIRAFAKEGIAFAYPTQTLYLAKA